MDEEKDLWADIDLSSGENHPIELLRGQAKLLEMKTDGVLKAIVETTTEEDVIYNTFYIVAPNLGDYRYALFKTASTSKPYPVFIYDNSIDDKAIAVKEQRKIIKNPFAMNTAIMQMAQLSEFFRTHEKVEYVGVAIPEPDINATSYSEFEDGIRTILSSKNTSAVIHSLMAQSKQQNA